VNNEIAGPLDEPTVTLNARQRTATVRFPRDFFAHFQHPENAGEQMVVRAIALGLLAVHEQTTAFETMLCWMSL